MVDKKEMREFERQIRQTEGLLILEFFDPEVKSSKRLSKRLESILADFPQITYERFDTREVPENYRSMDTREDPGLKFYRHGQWSSGFMQPLSGFGLRRSIERWIDENGSQASKFGLEGMDAKVTKEMDQAVAERRREAMDKNYLDRTRSLVEALGKKPLRHYRTIDRFFSYKAGDLELEQSNFLGIDPHLTTIRYQKKIVFQGERDRHQFTIKQYIPGEWESFYEEAYSEARRKARLPLPPQKPRERTPDPATGIIWPKRVDWKR